MSFRHLGNDIAAVQVLSFFHCDMSRPFFLPVKGINADAAGDEGTAGRFGDAFQRTFDPVKNIIQDTGSQSDRDSISACNNFLSGTQSCGFFVYLYGSQILIQGNDLTDQFLFAYIHHF